MKTAIEISNLTKKFKNFTAVEELSFSVQENHIVGFLGPNGAGKTTTIRSIVGLSKPTNGHIKVCQQDVVFGQTNANNRIGYLPELPSFYNWMSGYEYLSFIANIFKIDNSEKKILELLELTGLTAAKNRKIGGYSNGMKQRLGIAQALVHNPEVLILDEPVSSLDPEGRKDVMQIIEQLKSEKTILFSTHILADVDRICDDIVMINNGKLVASSPLNELKAQYAIQILEVEFNSDPEVLISKLKAEKWVKRVGKNGNQLRIWLTDTKVIQKNVPLSIFLENEVGVLSYGLKLPTAEDLFLQLLNKE